MYLTIEARVHCEHDGLCTANFVVDIPLTALGRAIDPELPRGWSLERPTHSHVPRVYCPKHCPEKPSEVSEAPERPEPTGGSEEPPSSILKRARDLQALAMDKSTSEHERANAWTEFGKLWKKYKLPPNLGLE